MATGKLSVLMANGMQSYINGLPTPKEDNYNFQDGYNAIFNKTEDYWNEVVEIDSDYIVPENTGNITIIIKSIGVAVDPNIFLPSIATNIGRRIFIINENAGHRIHLVADSGDNIEGIPIFDIHVSTHKNDVELIATSYGWKRKAKEFIIVPENLRPNGWTLLAGSSPTWTDVSFNTWVQKGAYAVLLKYAIQLVGNNIDDTSAFLLRPKGSTIDNVNLNTSVAIRYNNLASGITMAFSSQIIIECDSNAVIQYRKQDITLNSNFLFLAINGYFK